MKRLLLFLLLAQSVFGQVSYYGNFYGPLIGNAATATLATNAMNLVGLPSGAYQTTVARTLYVSTNYGNNATALFNSTNYPWQTLYDYTNSTCIGAMSCATNPGDTIVLLSDNQSPILPFKSQGVTLNLNGHTILRVTNTASISSWPINGWDQQPFDFPMVMMQDNCTLENGTLLYTNPPYGTVGGGSSVFFGMQFPQGRVPLYGTNLYQWLNSPAPNNNNCVSTNFGMFPQYGVTNSGATNFVCNNMNFDMVGWDLMFINDYAFDDLSDTNGNGDYFIQPYKPSQMVFNECQGFSEWDMWIAEGENVNMTFNRCVLTRNMNANGVYGSSAFCTGEFSTININGGSLADFSTSSNSLVGGLAAARNAIDSDPLNPATGPLNGSINLNGIRYAVEQCPNSFALSWNKILVNAAPASYSGWYIQTNGQSQFVSSGNDVMQSTNAWVTYRINANLSPYTIPIFNITNGEPLGSIFEIYSNTTKWKITYTNATPVYQVAY